MNQAMHDRVLELLRNPNFGDELVAEILAKRAALTAFAQSDTFRLMVASLAQNPGPVSIDSEDAAYFPDKVIATAGWPAVSKDDIDRFFSVVSSPSDDAAQATLSEDDDCDFDNSSFTNYGLQVFRMSGQGTFIRVSNR